jgi:hypothetical protein
MTGDVHGQNDHPLHGPGAGENNPPSGGLTRRDVLKRTATAVTALTCGGAVLGQQSSAALDASRPDSQTATPSDNPLAEGTPEGGRTPFSSQAERTSAKPVAPVENPAVARPWWLEGDRSRVVELRSENVVRNRAVDPALLDAMVGRTLIELSGRPTPARAWQEVLGDAQRIVLKFNAVGAEVLGTNDAMAEVLVEQLARAGYTPDRVALIEAPRYLAAQLGTRDPIDGWGGPIRLAGTDEPLVNYLHDADAVISVGLLKTHQIAGVTGCMKNLSHAIVRHPARYHANGCAPYVGQVIGSPPVVPRLRLCLLNALRVVYRRGPDAVAEDVLDFGGVLAGFDPVAVDAVGLSLLSHERKRLGIEDPISAPSILMAAEAGVGRMFERELDWMRLSV